MGNVYVIHDGELSHAGVKGMRWGVRRYQNADGTLTEAGKKRYGNSSNLVSTNDKKMPFGSTGGLYNKPKIPKDAKVDGYTPHKIPKNAKTATMKISELDQYKRSQRTKGVIKGIVGGAGVITAAVVTAPAIMLSWGLVNAVREM